MIKALLYISLGIVIGIIAGCASTGQPWMHGESEDVCGRFVAMPQDTFKQAAERDMACSRAIQAKASETARELGALHTEDYE